MSNKVNTSCQRLYLINGESYDQSLYEIYVIVILIIVQAIEFYIG